MTTERTSEDQSRQPSKNIIVGAGRLVGVYVGLLVAVGIGLAAVEAIAQFLGFTGDSRQFIRLVMFVAYFGIILRFTLRRRS